MKGLLEDSLQGLAEELLKGLTEPTSVSWHKAPDDKKSDGMAYDDIKEADLSAGFKLYG